MRLYQQKYIKKSEAAKGFTLVELLVVISIIALLLAILMPSLQKARNQAKRIVCLSNQKQISLAFVIYATENDDRLPTHYDESSAMATSQNASLTYYIKAFGEWTGFGRLYKTKAFSSAKAFYCPSQPKNSCFSYKNGWEVENREFPWNIAFHDSIQISSYMYRVFTQCNDTELQTGAYVDYLRKLKYSQIRGNMALVSDVFYKNYGYSYAPNVRTWAHSNPPGVNVSYSDGSAKWVATGKEHYGNSNDWIEGGRIAETDDYATVFFKCLDKENFEDLDEAHDGFF